MRKTKSGAANRRRTASRSSGKGALSNFPHKLKPRRKVTEGEITSKKGKKRGREKRTGRLSGDVRRMASNGLLGKERPTDRESREKKQ